MSIITNDAYIVNRCSRLGNICVNILTGKAMNHVFRCDICFAKKSSSFIYNMMLLNVYNIFVGVIEYFDYICKIAMRNTYKKMNYLLIND